MPKVNGSSEDQSVTDQKSEPEKISTFFHEVSFGDTSVPHEANQRFNQEERDANEVRVSGDRVYGLLMGCHVEEVVCLNDVGADEDGQDCHEH